MDNKEPPFSSRDGGCVSVPAGPPSGQWERASALGELWHGLVHGRARVVNGAASGAGDLLLLRKLDTPGRVLSVRSVRVLEYLLLGGSQKTCAVDIGLSTTSITALAKQALRDIGLGCLPSRVPLLLAILVSASRGQGVFPRVRVTDLERDGVRYVAVSFPRPDHVLTGALTDAERAVMALVLEGKAYVEIAEQRRTSVRTVANQIANAFHRLRVSGRGELLALVAKALSETTDGPALATPQPGRQRALRSEHVRA